MNMRTSRKQKTIGIFFGSRSPEHDISIITAMRVIEGFAKLSSYRAVPVYIGKNGDWFCGDALGDIGFFRDAGYEKKLAAYRIASFSFADRKLILYPRARGWFGSVGPIFLDVAFPCIHGSFGEDGTLQGLFEMAGVPYIGCGVLASALAMSKTHARRLLRDAGITSVPTCEISRDSFSKNRARAIAEVSRALAFPLFVKPNALGSSIGVSRVSSEQELEWALEVAFQFDTLALAEREVKKPKEVNVLVVGHKDLAISLPEEPAYHAAFQDFETKYLTKGGTIRQEKSAKTKSIIPAELSRQRTQEVREVALRVFRLLDCSGIMRCEFLLDTVSEELFLGEVNTLPGTLYAHVWEASGIPFPQLLEKLVGFAEERSAEEAALVRTFSSSVLQK
ncbi:MAG: D-alanine--D-alanine ligase [Candidatus Sungbacteria bacterium]|nr:D-alanine--D-alanine ligase [Candidatus Sungbacteria bacterium]